MKQMAPMAQPAPRDMLRVPLINCVNPDTQNIEVCCRDPNYVDPWPQNMPMPMGMNGGMKQMAPMAQPGPAPAPAPAPAPQPVPLQQQPINDPWPQNDNNGLAGINPRFQQQQQQQQQQAPRRKSGYGRK